MNDRTLTTESRTTTFAGSVVAGLVAITAALLGTTVVAQTALALGASDDFQPLTFGSYGTFASVGVIAGLIGWVLVRRSSSGAATLRWLVPTVFVVSLAPDIFLGFSDQPGVSWGAVAALMVMHLVVTVAAVATFARLLPVANHRASAPPGSRDARDTR